MELGTRRYCLGSTHFTEEKRVKSETWVKDREVLAGVVEDDDPLPASLDDIEDASMTTLFPVPGAPAMRKDWFSTDLGMRKPSISTGGVSPARKFF